MASKSSPSAAKLGTSDPVSYTCTCSQQGSVLLFYRYFGNEPKLHKTPSSQHLEEFANFNRQFGQEHGLTGKIRISTEGFNITIAGSHASIDRYIDACLKHWAFEGLGLEDEDKRQKFFKPTPGCRCVFTDLNVRVTSEITPLGVTNYSPTTWSAITPLKPEEFHRKCLEEEVMLIDVRNHYESKIGYFVSPKSGEAIKPPVRRFSQFPQWVKEHSSEIGSEGQAEKPLMTYCTGGIRCEKGVRWMEEHFSKIGNGGDKRPIYTLDGGIAAYITWMENEVASGRMTPEDSLFKGQNYVFDARGSVGIDGTEPVSSCHCCGIKSARLGKCGTAGCHIVLVVCEQCEKGDVRCCGNCEQVAEACDAAPEGPKPMCECEQAREKELWGGERVKEAKTQGWRKKKAAMSATTVKSDCKMSFNIKIKSVH